MDLCWHLVTLHLDVPTVLRLSEVSKQLKKVCQIDSLWFKFMSQHFTEHVGLTHGQCHFWYRDLYQHGAYYARQRTDISVRQAPTGVFLPLNDDGWIIATFRSKPVFHEEDKSYPSDWGLRHAGENYLLKVGNTPDLNLTGTEWSESSTTPNHKLEETHKKDLRRVIFGTNVYAFFTHPGRSIGGIARISPFRHAKIVRRAIGWLLDHFEIHSFGIRLPSYAEPEFGLADTFCVYFTGWLKAGNLLYSSEQKTPFTYDHNYDGGWCRRFDQEAQAYCEEPINMQYISCAKHPYDPSFSIDWSLNDQTDRDIEGDNLAVFYLRPGFITSHREGYPSNYSMMNGELIPTFDK
jgi:hypothetical protein